MKKGKYYIIICMIALAISGCSEQKESWNTEQNTSEKNTEYIDGNNLSPDDDEYTNGKITVDYPWGDGKYYMSIAGFMNYTKIKSDGYTDQPAEGMEYLILFLNLENYSSEDYYFNQECFSAYIDGVKIENTYLINDPEGYKTAFRKVKSHGREVGYIVWEVPKDWETFSFQYNGFKDADIENIHGELTHQDIFKIDKEKYYYFD